MPSYRTALKEAEKQAHRAHLESSAVKLLLMHFSGKSQTELYLDFELDMDESAYQNFQAAVRKYVVDRIPVQYIIGHVLFYGYKFLVNQDVLIPRFETEELVANVLIEYDELFHGKPIRLVDVGTGSGCLAISLKKEEEQWDVFATDISQEALDVAKKNADLNDCHVTFLQGDMLAPLFGQKFDILVSNPPYIPETETMDDIITKNEPHVALFGGSDGMRFYETILKGAKEILNDTFLIAFEHAYDKLEEMQSLSRHYFPNAVVKTLKDMQGKDRMTFIIQK